ncbi:MAG: 3-deoxy-manno-octulosonate cytidylyltransferase, partial [Phycisphaeraceae bacterium]|nr:3-deoxy-manno-octulosonate cytidylyltransferase [Phycisphaeraceae bacterium]
DRVIVATDHKQIQRAVQVHTHEAMLTRRDHPNGTCRVAEVAEAFGEEVDLIVNVQGDEPMIEPELIGNLIARMRDGDEPMGTVASPFADDEDPADPNIVKVVLDQAGRAMYFSRALIPHDRDGRWEGRPLKHVGLYAYRRPFLPVYVSLPPTPAETAEKLEQLRALEHGHRIAVLEATVAHHGIDTEAQYKQFVEVFGQRFGGAS